MLIGGHRGIERLEDKIILHRYSGDAAPHFDVMEGDTRIAAHITSMKLGLG